MVKPGQTVNIPVKHANDSDLGTQLPDVTTGWTPSINWQSATSLVTIDNSTASKGYFKVTASSSKTGNAEVMIKDGSGNILWSWHIWVTTYDPTFITNLVNANGNIWMDRNLGATAVASSGPNVEASGMFYQWGRKDPFPNYSWGPAIIPLFDAANANWSKPSYPGITIYNNPDAYVSVANGAANSPIYYSNALSYSVKNPMLYIFNWQGSTAISAETGYDSWGGEYGQPKSVYDPCPEGFRVASFKKNSTSPVSVINGSANGVGAYNTTNAYFVVNNNGVNMFFQYAGIRNEAGGFAYSNGTEIYMNYATATGPNAYGTDMYSASPGVINCAVGLRRDWGTQVRCVRVW
jgi:hypothetical protein